MSVVNGGLAGSRQGGCSTSYGGPSYQTNAGGCQHVGHLSGPRHTGGRRRAGVVTTARARDDNLLVEWPARQQVRTLAESVEAIGLGSWKLRGTMSKPFEVLAAVIEGTWRQAFDQQLSLYPLPQDLKFVDSMDQTNICGAWSYLDIADPVKGQEGYPRLLIENRAYCSQVFRKLHIELARRQDGMQVMHCVLYPKLEYDIPILSLDMVGNEKGEVSLAIVDPCPCVLDGNIPDVHREAARQLQEKYGLQNNRKIPEWGQDIFSDMCVIMRPQSQDELQRFMLYCNDLHRVYLHLSFKVPPLTAESDSGKKMENVRAAHTRYCEKQQENSKTTRVLESALGEEVAKRYMSEVMFDAPEQETSSALEPVAAY